ncbi:8-oxo-dGTP diphosphatase [Pedobacter sp. UYP30]|uniref:NUDIX hydrolase n=1 Tax=Pedobacter sp. UYP30 TaxID=1756400 RepID=UPI003390BF76
MRYQGQTRILVAVDCIVFGFDGEKIKLLLIQRGFAPQKREWSLMGGFLQENETLNDAAHRVLHHLTGLENVYLEQMSAFDKVERDPVERTLCLAYFALIDIHKYEKQLTGEFHAEWFDAGNLPDLIFDHLDMVKQAKVKLRYKAALHPILFELLPPKFTIPLLQNLYEQIYDTKFDSRNFSRKLLSLGLLVKLQDKDKSSSKKGAFYYQLDKEKYKEDFQAFLNLIPNPDKLLKENTYIKAESKMHKA